MNGNGTNRPILEVNGLRKYFNVKSGVLHAVDGVDLHIGKGETLGLVGESGCGKSTLGRVVIGLVDATEGEILFDGRNTLAFDKREKAAFRRRAQIVFQDPYSSLNPRMSVSQLIAEPLDINRACASRREMDKKVAELMDTVGIAGRLAGAYPHELDGGRRQRVGVARALALDPEFIVLDEPVSALDVCIQAQILNLLGELKRRDGYTYLFISHDLSVVKYVSDRIAVMYLGKIVETADRLDLFKTPQHPYTQALLSAAPIAKRGAARERIVLEGDVPSPISPPPGCRFQGRCRYRKDVCRSETPELRPVGANGHAAACHFAGELGA